MTFPLLLKNAIEREVSVSSSKQLSHAREELSKRYREAPCTKRRMNKEMERHSYLLTRMPATYAALTAVFSQISSVYPHCSFSSLLDLGAGPGTALWAAISHFPQIHQMTAIEGDKQLMEIGKKLAQTVFKQVAWESQDLAHPSLLLKPHDLVILSYVVGEIEEEERSLLIERAFLATNQLLIVVEPGTPAGFQRILRIRSQLISLGGHLVAPCPHALICPMAEHQWCHFGARLERSALHRQLKGATLGYEDEKFSYIAVSKEPLTHSKDRILRDPQQRPGHIRLQLCRGSGKIEEIVVSKKSGDFYKQTKKCRWGDVFDES